MFLTPKNTLRPSVLGGGKFDKEYLDYETRRFYDFLLNVRKSPKSNMIAPITRISVI